MKISRRDFVAYSSGLLSCLAPSFLKDKSLLQDGARIKSSNPEKKTLVMIHLAGGNDWFNTIIPFSNSLYYNYRPNIAIASDEVLPLSAELAFHPALSEMKKLYDANQVAVVLNTGLSDDHALSHHKANRLRQYVGTTNEITWMEKYANLTVGEAGKEKAFLGINIEPVISNPAHEEDSFRTKEQVLVSRIDRSKKFEFNLDIHHRLDINFGDCNAYQKDGFVKGMELISKAIEENTNATIYNISFGGFDTHCNQLERHSHLLSMLSEAIMSFQRDLEINGLAERVMVLISSEFGRSLRENESLGTDHGFINHVLVIGKGVNGGIYGAPTKFAPGNASNIAKCDFDIHRLYATVFDQWLSCSGETVFGRSAEALSLFKSV